ncbi:MAG: alpha/beta hydrolase [Chloroflexi bacterium]|nr:alpha/beta hydrolase [Chloroflexota bacterium]
MKKIILIVVFVLFVVIVAGGVWFWFALQQPLYEPGMARAIKNLQPPPQTVGKDFWNVEGDIKLYHYADGAGANVLVVHGGPGAPIAKPLPGLARLNANYKFHYYDQRGCGKSSRPIEKFSSSNYYENMQTLDKTLGLGAQIADIERIRQILGDEKIILVGHSFGGFLASLYAAEFPEHVRALILVAPAELLVMPPESGGLFEQIKPLLPDAMKAEYDAYMKRYLDFGALFSKTETELVSLNAEFARYYSVAAQRKGFTLPPENSSADAGGWMTYAMYMSMGLRHDYRAALKPVTAPVLVLHGANDLQPEQATRMYADAFPRAEFRIIQNAGHFAISDQPEEFARVVREFLGK